MANYILRRDGRDYQAPDLETMRQWASDGRVLPSDMVFSPRYQSWYRARDLRELRDVLPHAEQSSPPPVARPPQQFWVRKGDRNYVADSLQTVLEWASSGNISPEDLIYHPSYGKWFRAGDSPQLASRFPPHIMGARMPFIPPGDDPLGSGEYFQPETRSRPMTSPIQNPARRRSLVPRQRSRTGPVLIGGRRGRTRSGPFAPDDAVTQSLESADSTTKTVTDFSAGDVARAIQARRESGAVGLGNMQKTEANPAVPAADDMSPTAANPAVTDPEPRASRADWDARDEAMTPATPSVDGPAPDASSEGPGEPTPSEPDAPAALQPKPAAARPPEPAAAPEPPAEEAPPVAPEPAAAVESPAEPDPPAAPAAVVEAAASAAEASAPTGDRPALDAFFDDPGPFDDGAQLHDRLKLFKPFYAVAKVFLVTKDMRPGEVLEAEARIPGHSFKGLDKRTIYVAMREFLVEHMNGKLKGAQNLVTDEERPGYNHLCAAAAYLLAVLDGAYDTIGLRPPERFVVGNRGRPKMHPAEEEMMLDFDQAIKALVAVKARSKAA